MSRGSKWVSRGLIWLAELLAALAAHNAGQVEPAWASQLSVSINIDKDITRADAPDDDYIYWSN